MSMTTRRGVLGGGLGMAGMLPGLALAKAQAAEVPIRLDDNVPWTGVWINGQGPFRFNITSAGNVFSIDPEVARKLQLPLRGETISGGGPNKSIREVFTASQLVIGGQLRLGDVRLMSRSYEGDFPYVGTIPTPDDRITLYEFGAGRLTYMTEAPADLAAFTRLPLSPDNNRLGFSARVEGMVAGKLVRLRINTASPGALTLFPDAVKRLKLWDGPGYDRPGRYSQTSVTMRTGRRTDMMLGGLTFDRPLMSLFDPAAAVVDTGAEDGVIGMEVLRRCDLLFDPPHYVAWMRPTANMSEPWKHDRAGLGAAFKDGVATIVHVDPASPAGRAGLTAGMALPGLGPQDVSRLNAATYGRAGARLSFDVEQGGEKRRVSLTLEDRI